MPLTLVDGRLIPACEAANIDIDGLRDGLRHRHRCEVLRRVCLFNGTLVPIAGPDAERAQRFAADLVVRSPFGSHMQFPFAQLHPMNPADANSSAATLMKRSSLSRCTPLVWVPVWGFSFADSFVSSLVPIDELQSAGLIDEHVQLRPDLSAWPRSKNPIYRVIATLSTESVRTVREAAPKCTQTVAQRALAATAARHCRPKCYERLVVCQFRSTFDAYEPPMAPWRTAQRVAASLQRGAPVGATAALADSDLNARRSSDALRVVFVNRTRTKFSRSLTNLAHLLQVRATSFASSSTLCRPLSSLHRLPAIPPPPPCSVARRCNPTPLVAGASSASLMSLGAHPSAPTSKPLALPTF